MRHVWDQTSHHQYYLVEKITKKIMPGHARFFYCSSSISSMGYVVPLFP